MRSYLCFYLAFSFVSCAFETAVAQQVSRRQPFAIVIHGGAGSSPQQMSEANRSKYLRSLEKVLARGRDLLASGSSSLETVELVVRLMEDDPVFNAGKGAVMNVRDA